MVRIFSFGEKLNVRNPNIFPGAFLIPYFLCLVIAGIPIFFVELGIGQRLRRGSVACWNEISPYLGGIGIACMVVSFLVSVYYNMIIGWSFYYMFISMQEKLPYESCDGYDQITSGKGDKVVGYVSFLFRCIFVACQKSTSFPGFLVCAPAGLERGWSKLSMRTECAHFLFPGGTLSLRMKYLEPLLNG